MLRILAVVLMFASSAAFAKEVSVGPVSINLTSPRGTCAPDDSLSSDKKMVANIKGMIKDSGNTFMAVYSDCEELRSWRANKIQMIPHRWMYQSLDATAKDGISDSPAQLIKSTCDEFRSSGEKLADDNRSTFQERAKAVLKKVEVTGSVFMGVADETPDACYAANLQQFKLADGSKVKQVALWAVLVIKKRVIYYYCFAPFTDENSLARVLAGFKPEVADFLAANK